MTLSKEFPTILSKASKSKITSRAGSYATIFQIKSNRGTKSNFKSTRMSRTKVRTRSKIFWVSTTRLLCNTISLLQKIFHIDLKLLLILFKPIFWMKCTHSLSTLICTFSNTSRRKGLFCKSKKSRTPGSRVFFRQPKKSLNILTTRKPLTRQRKMRFNSNWTNK